MKGQLTTREQDAWRELIKKEAFCRVSWKVKYGAKYPRRVPDCGVSRKRCCLPALCLPKDNVSSATDEEITGGKEGGGQQVPGAREGIILQEPLPEMKPTTPQTAQLLYQGFSQEGEGRCRYLKERKMKGPEEKFYYPVLSSWEYGWRFGDVLKDIGTPIHGKSRIVKDTFYFKNGIFHYPSKTDKLS